MPAPSAQKAPLLPGAGSTALRSSVGFQAGQQGLSPVAAVPPHVTLAKSLRSSNVHFPIQRASRLIFPVCVVATVPKHDGVPINAGLLLSALMC